MSEAAAEFVSVINNRPSLIHLPEEIVFHDEKGNSPRANPSEGFSLIPGRNNVPRKVWETARKNKAVQGMLGLLKGTGGRALIPKAPNGKVWLEEAGDVASPQGVEAPDDLSGRSAPQAMALIDAEEEIDTLRRWLDAEDRADVKQAIRRRVGLLERPAAEAAKSTPRGK